MQLKRYADFGAARHLPADTLAKAGIRDVTSAKNRKANGRGEAAAGEFYAGEARDALA